MLTLWDAKLHKAAVSGDLYALQQLLDSGKTDVDSTDQVRFHFMNLKRSGLHEGRKFPEEF